MTVDIGFCRPDEVDDLARFIDRYWSAGHVLARDRRLVDFQHRDPVTGGYHVVVARSHDDEGFLGVLGYIPTSRYDPALAERSVTWLALWKVRADAAPPGLGVRMIRFLETRVPAVTVATAGINDEVERLYRALGYRTGVLDHDVLPAAHREAFALLQGPIAARPPPTDVRVPRYALRRLDEGALTRLDGTLASRAPTDLVPEKTAAYVVHRYLRHPSYAYEVHVVEDAGDPLAVLVLRVVEHDGARALRVVDRLGDPAALGGCGPALQAILAARDAEYVDVVSHGLPAEALRTAGFRRLDHAGDSLVPHHFEPFEPRNVAVRFAYRPVEGRQLVVCKGDGDLDRPSTPAPHPARRTPA